MGDKNLFPADAIPQKPDAIIGSDQIEYVRGREIGRVSTRPLWEPSELDIEYFNKLRSLK